MFFLIGAGISGFDNIPFKGVSLCKSCDYVFLERYTSILSDEDLEKLSKLIGRSIIELDREDLETRFKVLVLDKARVSNVALLVVGDPLTATTHIEFLRNCREEGVGFEVVHASSIYSSVCESGLFIYKFGKSCSVPYPEKGYEPTSFFDIIEENHNIKAHTLVFLDIKKSEEKYMTINEALMILLRISSERNGFFNESTEVIGISRLGFKEQVIKYGKVRELLSYDFGKQPHILIIPSMSEIEREYVESLYKQ